MTAHHPPSAAEIELEALSATWTRIERSVDALHPCATFYERNRHMVAPINPQTATLEELIQHEDAVLRAWEANQDAKMAAAPKRPSGYRPYDPERAAETDAANAEENEADRTKDERAADRAWHQDRVL